MSTEALPSAADSSTRPEADRQHVVQVALSYPPRIGGMENVTQAIAQHLAAAYRVEVLTTTVGAERAPHTETTDGVRVRRCRGVTVAHTPVSPGLVLALLVLPRSSIVHAHLTHAFLPEAVWLTSRLRRRPYIAHFHLDVDPSGPLGFLLRHYKRLVFGPVLRAAHTVIALSDAQADFLSASYGVSRDRLTVVPNGVSDAFFRIRAVVSTRSAPRRLRLLFVGRLDPQKNVQRLLEAVSLCTGMTDLVVVGDGEERDRLVALVADLGLRHVRLVGTQRGADLQRWYSWADAFVLTSDREGMSISLLEAMAAGLPVIATRVPGTVELLEGVGALAAPTPTDVAATISQVATDADLRHELATRSREAGRKLSWPNRISQLDEIYLDLQRNRRC